MDRTRSILERTTASVSFLLSKRPRGVPPTPWAASLMAWPVASWAMMSNIVGLTTLLERSRISESLKSPVEVRPTTLPARDGTGGRGEKAALPVIETLPARRGGLAALSEAAPEPEEVLIGERMRLPPLFAPLDGSENEFAGTTLVLEPTGGGGGGPTGREGSLGGWIGGATEIFSGESTSIFRFCPSSIRIG